MSHMVTQLCGFGSAAGVPSLTVSYTDGYEDTSSAATTHTDAGKSIGAAAADRKIIVAIGAQRTTAVGISISSVTATGSGSAEAGTLVSDGVTNATQLGGTSNRNGTWLYAIDGGAGSNLEGDTTASISITFNGATYLYACGIYHMIGAASATASDVNNDATGDPLTVSHDVPAGGGVIAVAFNAGTTTNTWAGVDSDYVGFGGGNGTAHKNYAAQQTGLSVEFNPATPNSQTLTVASWGP